MLQLFPFLGLLATVVSIVLIAMLWFSGDFRARGLAMTVACLSAAAYLQFESSSATASAAGLALQTLLAIVLICRWRLGA